MLKQFSLRCTPKKQNNLWSLLKKSYSQQKFKVHTRGRAALDSPTAYCIQNPCSKRFAELSARLDEFHCYRARERSDCFKT
jgi:hypothetical protein